MQEAARFPFRTSVIIRLSEVSANQLIIYAKKIQHSGISDPKLIMKDPKNAVEAGKPLKSALLFANSHLNQEKLLSGSIENKFQLVWIWHLKITCSRPKIDHIRLKSCKKL